MILIIRIKIKVVMMGKSLISLLVSNFSAKKHLSGNGFKEIADLEISNLDTLNLKRTSLPDLIFVKSDFVIEFLTKNRDSLENKIVIAGNGDTNFDVETEEMLVPKKLFLQNLGFKPSVTSIKVLPIGLENYEHVRSGFGFMHFPPKEHKVTNKVLIPPMSPTNEVRKKVLEDLKGANSDVFHIESKIRSIIGYLKLTKKFKFILVCEGNGHDTHRLWEVLYQNSFPVLIETNFSRRIAELGLPVLVVESIKDLDSKVLQDHLKKYENYTAEGSEILWLKYWKNSFKTMNEN